MMKARALYDNISETADELGFLRDDVLEVIERDYDGMEGWWLCGLRGKTGIAPSNRLVLITVIESPTDYDTPKSRFGSTEKNKRNSQRRKTESDDYDTPASHKSSDPISSDRKIQKNKSKLSKGVDAKEFEDYCVPSRNASRSSDGSDTSCKSSPQILANNFGKYIASYKKYEKDMSVVVTQISNMMGKWLESPMVESKAHVVKTICVSLWKALQAYVAEAAKTIASIKTLVKSDTFKSFETIKETSTGLESVLDFLNSYGSLKADEKQNTYYLQQLSSIITSLKTHAQILSDFFARVEQEKLWLTVAEPSASLRSGSQPHPKGKSPNILQVSGARETSNSYGDYDTPPANPKKRCSPSGNSLKIDTTKSISTSNRLQPAYESSETLDYATPKTFLSVDQLSMNEDDYDRPKSSEILHSHRLRMNSSEYLDYDSPKNPVKIHGFTNNGNNARSKSVLSSGPDDQLDYDTPSNNASVVRLRLQEDQLKMKKNERLGLAVSEGNAAGSSIKSYNRSMNKIMSCEALDYDYPLSQAESADSTSSHNSLRSLSSTERKLLRYYFPFIAEELKSLLALIALLQRHLRLEGGPQQMVLINDVKSLAACSHKVLFIVDSILKRTPAKLDLNNQLNFSCSKICDYLKNITNLVKQMSQPSSSTHIQKQLLSSVPEFLLHVQSMNQIIYYWK